MIKTTLGAVAAAIAMFMWGFLYWGSGIIDPFTHMSPAAESAIADAARTTLTADGVYFVPESQGRSEEEWGQRMSGGPILMFNFRAGGALPMEQTMGLGFLHMLATALLIGIVLQHADGLQATFVHRVQFIAGVALLASFAAHLGSPIWWHYPWTYALIGFGYDFGSLLIGGMIVAFFATPRST